MGKKLASAQHPFACIIACSDSRVAPEFLFDRFLGDLFVIRLPGNVITPEVVESTEFAVRLLHVPLIVVLGHSSCAAMEVAWKKTGVRGDMLGRLSKHLQPALAAAQRQGWKGDRLLCGAIEQHVRLGVRKLLTKSAILSAATARGRLAVLGAVYDLKDRRVEWLADAGHDAFRPQAP